MYFWEGKEASSLRYPTFVLGLQPLLEEKLMKQGGSRPEVQRIQQGKEPLSFMKIFNSMISISRGLPSSLPSLNRLSYDRLMRVCHFLVFFVFFAPFGRQA